MKSSSASPTYCAVEAVKRREIALFITDRRVRVVFYRIDCSLARLEDTMSVSVHPLCTRASTGTSHVDRPNDEAL